MYPHSHIATQASFACMYQIYKCSFETCSVTTCTTAAGPGFPGYPNPPPPQSQPVGATGSEANPDPTPSTSSSATEEVGGASSSSSAPPASRSPAAALNSQGRTGLFQSQNSFTGASQSLLEPQGSFAFSARSLSSAASVDGEAQAEDQQQSEEVSTPTTAHSASFTIGVEEDVNTMEIRQRRLQRFHSSPVSPQSGIQDGSSETSKTGVTTIKAGLTGEAGATSDVRASGEVDASSEGSSGGLETEI